MAKLLLSDGTFFDLDQAHRKDLINAIEDQLPINNENLLDALNGHDDLSSWRNADYGDYDASPDPYVADLEFEPIDREDLGRAIDAASRAHDPERQLADVLHYLTRAIPDLEPLVALVERETGKRMRP